MSKLPESDSPPKLAGPEDIEILSHDLFEIARTVFGAVFLTERAATEYQKTYELSAETFDISDTDDYGGELDLVVVPKSRKNGSIAVDVYKLSMISFGRSAYEGYKLATSNSYEIDPKRLQASCRQDGYLYSIDDDMRIVIPLAPIDRKTMFPPDSKIKGMKHFEEVVDDIQSAIYMTDIKFIYECLSIAGCMRGKEG